MTLRNQATLSLRRRKPMSLLLCAALLLSSAVFGGEVEPAAAQDVTVTSSGSTWVVDTSSRTEEQVRAAWEQFKPTFSGERFVKAPRLTDPYTTGEVAAGFLADGVNAINFARYLAGLPYDVTLDSTHVGDAQHGAVLLATSPGPRDGSWHYPLKPSDMCDDFYATGLQSTSTSNIGWGHTCAVHFQERCLQDESAGNIAHVGHRRWLLNPPMRKTGIGYALTSEGGRRYTTYAFDRSRTESVDYTTIGWPSAGAFPVEQFGPNVPWSITLNPERFTWGSEGHRVMLRRVSDGKTWSFSASDKDVSGTYFNLSSFGAGVPNAFIFRPDPKTISYKPGDEFDVMLYGGIYHKPSGSPATVSYRTRFVALSGSLSSAPSSSPAPEPPATAQRVAGSDRYATAVALAKMAYPGFKGVTDVVVASGEDRSAADPLSAAGLCGVLDAPLLLVTSRGVPSSVDRALKAMPSRVRVTIVGGTASVPESVRRALLANPQVSSVDRVAGSDRYDTGRRIAERMKRELGPAMPRTALIANGADPAAYFDALALSAVSANKNFPILLVTRDSVPASTAAALRDHAFSTRIIGGGPAVVTERVRSQLGAQRWSGRDRFATAADIAAKASARGWAGYENVGVASSLPDALTGGAALGASGGVLLLTMPSDLPGATEGAVRGNKAHVDGCYVFGGTKSVTDTVRSRIDRLLH